MNRHGSYVETVVAQSVAVGDFSAMGNAFNTESEADEEEWSIHSRYDVGELLGSGSFGQVRSCVPLEQDENGHVPEYAVKIVDRRAMAGTQTFLTVEDEIHILENLHHPHVLQLIETFEDDRFLYIVMEKMDGGELFQAIGNPSITVREDDVARVARDLLSALEYLHDSGVVHRDVKAENVLLEEPPDRNLQGGIKLIDFGLAATFEKGKCMGKEDEEPLDLFCGSPFYVAPEIFHVNRGGRYGVKVDVWASGVMLYLALYGQPPFWAGPGRNSPQDLEPVITGPQEPAYASARCPGWQPSKACRDCLSKLFSKDPSERPSAAEAMAHSWLRAKTRGVGLGSAGMVPAEVRAQALQEVRRMPVSLATEQERTAAFEALRDGART